MVTMDSTDILNLSCNTSSDNTSNTSTAAKLRRLKIQEKLLLQSIKKNIPSIPTGYDESENSFIKCDLEFKKFSSELKKIYNDIKQLFEDVKCTTKTKEILKTLDLDDVKRDVLELEDKIRSFKKRLQIDLADFKKIEIDLVKQVENNVSQSVKIKKYSKVLAKSYSDIIPSPVKNFIKSPFKCPEVQQFQDFLSSSHKHGGWNEYNHNMFVRIWEKHFQYDEDYIDTDKMDCIDKNSFIDEIIEKISGVRKNDVIAHMKWYAKYLHLKICQQKALDEWKAKTRPKQVQRCINQELSTDKCLRYICNSRKESFKKTLNKRDENSFILETSSEKSLEYSPTMDEDKFFKETGNNDRGKVLMDFHFTKPTKQWENRCNNASEPQVFHYKIEDFKKLRTPSWRIGLDKE